jgi:NAD(P)-dependent dehydrogenase (short-subunit alcohol dehydrogenase family)
VKQLTNKAAVITGAASGIGYALAERLGREGVRLTLADIEPDSLARAVDQLTASGVEAIGIPTDVSSWPSVEHLASSAEARFGPVDILFNNAGVERLGISTWDTPLSLWEWILGVDLWGVIHGIRAFVPTMVQRGDGYVVNTASLAGLVVSPDHAPYTAAKHAVVGISESMYHEFHARALDIGISVVCPALVQTRILEADRNWRAELGDLPEQGEYQREARGRMAHATPACIVADHVVDAIVTDRFWVLPHGHADKVGRRFATLGTETGPPELWRLAAGGDSAPRLQDRSPQRPIASRTD